MKRFRVERRDGAIVQAHATLGIFYMIDTGGDDLQGDAARFDRRRIGDKSRNRGHFAQAC